MEETGISDEVMRVEVNEQEIKKILLDYYGITAVSMHELHGWDAVNYYVRTNPDELRKLFLNDEDLTQYYKLASANITENNQISNSYSDSFCDSILLKFHGAKYSRCLEAIETQCAISKYLINHKIMTAIPIKTLDKVDYLKNSFFTTVDSKGNKDNRVHIVMAYTFFPGKQLYEVTYDRNICELSGILLARLNVFLQKFTQETERNLSFNADSYFNPLNMKMSESESKYIPNESLRNLVKQVYILAEQELFLNLKKFAKTIIHGDLHESNLIFNKFSDNKLCIIDWEDMTYSYRIFELAIFISGLLITNQKRTIENQEETEHKFEDCEDLIMFTLEKFNEHLREIDENIALSIYEAKALWIAICSRLAFGIVMGNYTYYCVSVGNEYVLKPTIYGGPMLKVLWKRRAIFEEKVLKVCKLI